MNERLLLDVTRLISRSWTRRLSTGIDRVAYAYLRRFAPRAHAVVQHRGFVRVLDRRNSHSLFDMLLDSDHAFRRRLMAFAPQALIRSPALGNGNGGIYINVNHTDFDLDSHARWTRRAALRPVYLLHDLIPVTHARHCREHAVNRHRGRVIGALRHAAGIVVSTRAVAHDLKAFARHEGLSVPPLLIAPIAGESLVVPILRDKAEHPFFLCLGTIESRKNQRMLLDIWGRLIVRLGASAPRLVIVGQWGFGSQVVRDLLEGSPGLRDHVTIHSQCDDFELAHLVAGAQALLMPTLAEGYGLPMVEALKLGTPVIASDLPCLREIGQGIPTLLPPGDDVAWEAMIGGFSTGDPEHARQKMSMAGFRPPTWDAHFACLDAWLPGLSGHVPVPAPLPFSRSMLAPSGEGNRILSVACHPMSVE